MFPSQVLKVPQCTFNFLSTDFRALGKTNIKVQSRRDWTIFRSPELQGLDDPQRSRAAAIGRSSEVQSCRDWTILRGPELQRLDNPQRTRAAAIGRSSEVQSCCDWTILRGPELQGLDDPQRSKAAGIGRSSEVQSFCHLPLLRNTIYLQHTQVHEHTIYLMTHKHTTIYLQHTDTVHEHISMYQTRDAPIQLFLEASGCRPVPGVSYYLDVGEASGYRDL
ncbi:hypothetical protein WMY93_019625 [Mugilogobius chulae]|uniref:Uncharacterized protein n=1 Tax=Mugilogobius chulae TaxID=88201 RepID=A0AAW0NQT1_9GOBI